VATDDFWQYALFAAVAYIHAAIGRAGAPVRRTCQDPVQRLATWRHNDQVGTPPAGHLTVGRPIRRFPHLQHLRRSICSRPRSGPDPVCVRDRRRRREGGLACGAKLGSAGPSGRPG
jgi:hypothetical protein